MFLICGNITNTSMDVDQYLQSHVPLQRFYARVESEPTLRMNLLYAKCKFQKLCEVCMSQNIKKIKRTQKKNMQHCRVIFPLDESIARIPFYTFSFSSFFSLNFGDW